MKFEDIVRLPDPRRSVKAEVREVIRDVQERPHVFVRVRLTGWHFPQRAPEPFLTIGRAVSAFVLIGREGTSADAYFDIRPPAAERVSFGGFSIPFIRASRPSIGSLRRLTVPIPAPLRTIARGKCFHFPFEKPDKS